MRIPITAGSLEARLEQKYIPEPNTGCWLWIGGMTRSGGYGIVARSHRKDLSVAHRASYEFYRGAIPAGLELDHLCRVRSCVNPYHVEPVTRKENARRGLRGVLSAHCLRGHQYTGELDTRGWRRCRDCDRVRRVQ